MPWKDPKRRREYLREHYRLNPQMYKDNAARQKQKSRTALRAAKAKPCTDCGIQYPYWVMQFDHVRGKKLFDLSTSYLRRGHPAVLAEIEKCDVVCANCHAERTHCRMVQRQDGAL